MKDQRQSWKRRCFPNWKGEEMVYSCKTIALSFFEKRCFVFNIDFPFPNLKKEMGNGYVSLILPNNPE
jgi:hypothetical protein